MSEVKEATLHLMLCVINNHNFEPPLDADLEQIFYSLLIQDSVGVLAKLSKNIYDIPKLQPGVKYVCSWYKKMAKRIVKYNLKTFENHPKLVHQNTITPEDMEQVKTRLLLLRSNKILSEIDGTDLVGGYARYKRFYDKQDCGNIEDVCKYMHAIFSMLEYLLDNDVIPRLSDIVILHTFKDNYPDLYSRFHDTVLNDNQAMRKYTRIARKYPKYRDLVEQMILQMPDKDMVEELRSILA